MVKNQLSMMKFAQGEPAAWERVKAPIFKKRGFLMLKWILILLIVAAVAGLLGMNSLAGAAMTGAKILIAIVLILFLLAVLGIVAIA